MSSTRKAPDNSPLSQERYMSSREFSELRGVSATAVAARIAVMISTGKRQLIWWLQAMSLKEGGLRKFAENLIETFPKRLQGADAAHAARTGHACYKSGRGHGWENSIEDFLIDLCINPRLLIASASDKDLEEIERDHIKNACRELDNDSFERASLSYFEDITGALIEFKRRYEHTVKENFQHTQISKKIWETLDFALATKNMVLLDGLEGRGKTEAVKAWCELHLGEARFVSLKGINNKTTAFREIAKALGIGGSGYKSTELQGRIEDVLQRSKLMLLIDEAHFIFNQRQRIYTRPELVDWIDTAICNRKIPIALVTTPQFMICMTRAAAQVDWNYRQFRRRVRRYVKLPAQNTQADIENVARRMLPGAPTSALKLVVGYALLSKRDLSVIGDVVDEIKAIQETETLSKVTFDQIKQAVDEHLLPSDQAFAEALKATEKSTRGHAPKTEKYFTPDSEAEAVREEEPGANRPAEIRGVEAPKMPVLING